MKKYMLISAGFFILFSFNSFADSSYKRDCFAGVRVYHEKNFGGPYTYPWREPYDPYVTQPYDYIHAWESYLACIKQEGEATEAKIQSTQDYIDYLQQDYDKYRVIMMNHIEHINSPEVEEVTYGGCTPLDRYHLGRHFINISSPATTCLLD